MADNLEDKLKELEKQLKEMGVASDSIKSIADNFKDAQNAALGLAQTVEEANKVISDSSGLDDEIIDKKRQALNAAKLALSMAEKHGAISEEELERQRLLIKDMQKSLSLEEKRTIAMQKSLDKLIGMKKEAIGLGSHLDAISHIWNNMSNQEALERVINKLADGMAKFANAIIKSSLELDAVGAKVAKATSTTQFTQPMEELRNSALAAGESVDGLGENFIALNNNYSNFNRIDISAAKQLADTSMRLNAAGFSAEAFARSLDIGVKSLNMSETQVETFTKELVSFGKASGISMDRLSRDLISAGPKLVTFGTQGQRIFKEMSLAAKNLGIEMDRMFGITEQYTTFEGAAGAAAKLNSVLGGNFINSLDLMNAALDNPAEAFRLIKDSMDASGKSFDDMTPAMKRVVAEAGGFNDINEAAKAFNNSIDENSESIEEQAITQEKLNEMNRSFISLQEKLNKLLAQMTPVLMPIIDALSGMVDGLAELVEEYPEVFKFLGWTTAFAAGIGAVSMAVLIFVANFALAAKALVAVKAPFQFVGNLFKKAGDDIGGASNQTQQGGKKLGNTLKNIGDAVKGSWKEIVAFGAAIALIGVGIWAASSGLAELVKAFSELTGAQIAGALGALLIVMGGFVAIIYAMIPAVAALGGTAAVTAGPLLGLGGAFALIGLGIGLAGYGIAQIVKAFGTLGDVVRAVGEVITGSIDSLSNFFKVLADINVMNLLSVGPALLAIATGMTALIAASSAGSLANLFGVGPFSKIEELSKLATDTFATNITKIADSIERIAKAMSTTVNSGLIEQLRALEKMQNIQKLAAVPVASTTTGTISVQDIVVKNTIRSEEGSSLIKQEPITINLSVPVKIDGAEFRNVMVGVAKNEIKTSSNTASAVNVRVS